MALGLWRVLQGTASLSEWTEKRRERRLESTVASQGIPLSGQKQLMGPPHLMFSPPPISSCKDDKLGPLGTIQI